MKMMKMTMRTIMMKFQKRRMKAIKKMKMKMKIKWMLMKKKIITIKK